MRLGDDPRVLSNKVEGGAEGGGSGDVLCLSDDFLRYSALSLAQKGEEVPLFPLCINGVDVGFYAGENSNFDRTLVIKDLSNAERLNDFEVVGNEVEVIKSFLTLCKKDLDEIGLYISRGIHVKPCIAIQRFLACMEVVRPLIVGCVRNHVACKMILHEFYAYSRTIYGYLEDLLDDQFEFDENFRVNFAELNFVVAEFLPGHLEDNLMTVDFNPLSILNELNLTGLNIDRVLEKEAGIHFGPAMFRLICQNVLRNAQTAGARNIVITMTTQDKKVLIRFYDDGKLIPDDILIKLFKDKLKTSNGLGYGSHCTGKLIEDAGGSIGFVQNDDKKYLEMCFPLMEVLSSADNVMAETYIAVQVVSA